MERMKTSDAPQTLAELIVRHAREEGVQATAIPRLHLIRMSSPSAPVHTLHEPALCVIAQGSKQLVIGERVYVYDPTQYSVVSVDLPLVGQVLEASEAAPYLCLRLDLDAQTLAAMIVEAAGPAPDAPPALGLTFGPMTPGLHDAVARLVGLLDAPEDIPALAPLVEREILYRLMQTDEAARLRQIALAHGRLSQVNRAIGWIKRNFRQPFSIERLAEEARMSASSLHRHFKGATGMSPLQYQKQLRLQEARCLILANGMDAASASFAVGYESPSQFSREYRRLFGAPPLRDVARLRGRPEAVAGV